MMYLSGVNRAVETGETYFGEIARLPIGASTEAKRRLRRGNLSNYSIYNGKPMKARIEHARWIVDCPNCDNAEMLFEDKLFFCTLCRNTDIGGKLRKVSLPAKRKAIENILSIRPIKNRNWYPNETLEDLEKENKEHGLEMKT